MQLSMLPGSPKYLWRPKLMGTDTSASSFLYIRKNKSRLTTSLYTLTIFLAQSPSTLLYLVEVYPKCKWKLFFKMFWFSPKRGKEICFHKKIHFAIKPLSTEKGFAKNVSTSCVGESDFPIPLKLLGHSLHRVNTNHGWIQMIAFHTSFEQTLMTAQSAKQWRTRPSYIVWSTWLAFLSAIVLQRSSWKWFSRFQF